MAGGKRSVDLSSADIQEAWQEVRSDKSETNWYECFLLIIFFYEFFQYRILLSYGENTDIVLTGKGTGGLAEMKAQLNESQVYFGVVRVRAVDDHGSKRAKFVFVTYVGAGVVCIILFKKQFIYEFLYLISLQYVVHVYQHINLNLKDFLMAFIFKSMQVRKMI